MNIIDGLTAFLEDAAIEFVSEKLYIWMPTPNDGD
jgi:hypothetical protein